MFHPFCALEYDIIFWTDSGYFKLISVMDYHGDRVEKIPYVFWIVSIKSNNQSEFIFPIGTILQQKNVSVCTALSLLLVFHSSFPSPTSFQKGFYASQKFLVIREFGLRVCWLPTSSIVTVSCFHWLACNKCNMLHYHPGGLCRPEFIIYLGKRFFLSSFFF